MVIKSKLFTRLKAVAVVIVAAAALSVVYKYNPVQVPFFPQCTFYELTGLYCPGCGATRAMHQLLHGHIFAALHYNPLFVIMSPFIAWAVVKDLFQVPRSKKKNKITNPVWIWTLFAVIITFWVLRNIPIHPFNLMAPGERLARHPILKIQATHTDTNFGASHVSR